MKEYAKYITVLDYDKGEVFVYPIELWNIAAEPIENALHSLGHNILNCKWMVHTREPIIKTIGKS